MLAMSVKTLYRFWSEKLSLPARWKWSKSTSLTNICCGCKSTFRLLICSILSIYFTKWLFFLFLSVDVKWSGSNINKSRILTSNISFFLSRLPDACRCCPRGSHQCLCDRYVLHGLAKETRDRSSVPADSHRRIELSSLRAILRSIVCWFLSCLSLCILQ